MIQKCWFDCLLKNVPHLSKLEVKLYIPSAEKCPTSTGTGGQSTWQTTQDMLLGVLQLARLSQAFFS